jgi:hypothetical protein
MDDDQDDDFDWAKPLVDEGLAQLVRGESFTHKQVFERLQRIIDRASAGVSSEQLPIKALSARE